MTRIAIAVLLLLPGARLAAQSADSVAQELSMPKQAGALTLVETRFRSHFYEGERIWSPFTDGAMVSVDHTSYDAELDTARARLLARGQDPEHLSFQILPEVNVEVPEMGIVARQLTMIAETGRDPFFFWRHYYFLFRVGSCVVTVYTGHAEGWAKPELLVPAVQELMHAIAEQLRPADACRA